MTRSEPLFSVVIPTFNRRPLLAEAIDSVRRQSFQNFELIVVDDGSTDDTQEFLQTINDSRVVPLRQENRGRSAARNAGLRAARGTFVTFLDSDDLVRRDWLDRLAAELVSDDVAVVCCGSSDFSHDPEEEKNICLPRNLGPVYEGRWGNFSAVAFAVRRDVLNAVGGYEESLAFAENTELALRLIPFLERERLRIACVAEPLARYRVRPLEERVTDDTVTSLLDAALYILAHHGQKYRERSPREYTNYCAIAGVNSARLGRYRDARRYFRHAVRVYPAGWKNYARYVLALVPGVRDRFWRRRLTLGRNSAASQLMALRAPW